MTASLPWFRFYDEALDDPKVQRMPAALFRYWINVLALANRGTPRGALPPIEDVAFALRIDEETAGRLMAELRKRQLVDDVDGVTYPHNWNGRQFQSDGSTARVSAWRKRRGTAESESDSETVHETLHATDSGNDAPALHGNVREQIQSRTETEQNDGRAADADAPTLGDADDDKPKAKPRRRIPTDWTLTPELREYAIAHGVPAESVDDFAEEFRTYWTGDGRPKADWDQTFRNRAIERGPTFAIKNGRAKHDANLYQPEAPDPAPKRTPEQEEAARRRRDEERAKDDEARAALARQQVEQAREDARRPPTVTPESWAGLTEEARRRFAAALY